MTSKTIRKMCALAGVSVLAAMATATPVDARIMIDRALNSPTLTIRYDGANAALVELRVNGESIGTRSVVSSKTNGETNFDINLSELKDGDNDVEVRLYDRTGKLVGSDKSNISTDQSNYGPVFLKTPKVGATVLGNVEIDMGFGRELKNVYVSFFVDSNFKKMTNYPPYNMVWDTTGESNGWHELEAWAIDETSTTFKTRKTRVFVNNPGGNTHRLGVDAAMTKVKPEIHSSVEGMASTSLRNIDVKGESKFVGSETTSMAPRSDLGTTVSNVLRTTVGGMSHSKPAPVANSFATGPRLLAPTFDRVAVTISSTSRTILGANRPTRKLALNSAPAASAHSISIVPHVQVQTGPTQVATAPRAVSTTKTIFALNSAPKTGGLGHVVPSSVGQAGAVLRNVGAAANFIRITQGQRIPNLTTFEVILNSSIVEFPDVQPRVDDGVPMTPLRYLLEKAGGTVDWQNMTKTVNAKTDGQEITLQIGDRNAKINNLSVSLEVAPYIDRGRTIVPLSFIHDALKVNVDYDKETGHVLITSANK